VATRPVSRERYSFGNLKEPLELPDLIAIQRESFEWFLNEGLANTFRDISPIKDFSESLQLELEFDPFDEDLRPPPKFTVEECKEKDMTYSAPVFVRARFMNRNTGEIKEQTVFMGDFPIMTDKGTFIVNGTERVVVSQLVRSPGVIFEPGERFRLRNLTKHQLVKGTIHPYRGEWMEFDVEHKPGKDVTAGTRVARKRRLGIFTMLRALGYDEENAPGFLDRFVAHCVDLAERVSAGLRGPDEARCAALLDEQTSNLEAAHARALEAGAMDAAVRIAAAPYVLVYQRLRADIGAWAEATLAAAVGSDHPLAAVVAAIAALNRLNRGDPEGAAELLSELPDDPLARHGHEVLGDLHTYRGDLTSAFDHFDRAAELARTAEDDFTAGFARASAAITLGYAGRVDEALALAAQVRSAARAAGSELVVCWCDYAEAEALTERDPLHALELVDRVVGRADAAGWQMLAGVGRLTASSLRARVADPEDAIPGFQRLIGHWDRLGDQTHQWTTLRNLVELLTRLEASVPAARLLGAVGHAPTPTFGPEQRRLDEAATRLRHHLGGRFDELVRDGQVDELTDAVDHALRALAELPS